MGKRYVKCSICASRLVDLLSIDEKMVQENGKNVCSLCIRARELIAKWEKEDLALAQKRNSEQEIK